ncbi:MAG: glycosyltransferase family 2 protein [Gemmatimonadales bacterium]
MNRIPRVTVAICTWNRAELLRQTLEQMTRLVVPSGLAWELVVVNNNCTDATDDVIASFASPPRLPVCRAFEPNPGLSHARNRAAEEAKGEYILWTDDDVLAEPGWLAESCRAFERRAEAVIFGGPIAPWFPNPPPRWLEQSWPVVAHAYAALDLGDAEIPLTEQQVPFGANFATRSDVARAVRFDPALGVRPTSRMGGEETDLIRRVLRNGGTGWWVPGARVRHYVPVERQTLGYLRRWYGAYGEYLGRQPDNVNVPHLFGRPRWLWREVVRAWVAFAVRRPFRPAPVWIDDFIRGSTAWGHLRRGAPTSREVPPQIKEGSR